VGSRGWALGTTFPALGPIPFFGLRPLGKNEIPASLTIELAKFLVTDLRHMILHFDRWNL